MNKIILIVVIIILIAIGAWLAFGDTDFSERTDTPGPVDDVTTPDEDVPTNGEEQVIPAVSEVVNYVVQEMDVDAEEIELISIEEKDWPDACLGLPEEDEMCATVITPGFEIVVAVGEEEQKFRTNIEGMIIRADK